MSAITGRTRGRPRNEHHDDAILDATIDLVSAVGLANLTIDAVAKRAGVGKATIYRRWSSKEALLLDAWVSVVDAPAIPDTGTLRGDLDAYFDTKTTTGRPAEAMQCVYLQLIAAAKVDPQLGDTLHAFFVERRKPLRTLLERAVERGELPADIDLELVQDLLVAPFVYRWLFTDRQVDPRVVSKLVDVVLAGVSVVSRATPIPG